MPFPHKGAPALDNITLDTLDDLLATVKRLVSETLKRDKPSERTDTEKRAIATIKSGSRNVLRDLIQLKAERGLDALKARYSAIRQVYEAYNPLADAYNENLENCAAAAELRTVTLANESQRRTEATREGLLEDFNDLIAQMKKVASWDFSDDHPPFSPSFDRHKSHWVTGREWKAYIEKGRVTKWRLYFVMDYDQDSSHLDVTLKKIQKDH